jgi:uncharacterized protein DUF2071
MLHILRRHPFPVKAEFRHSMVLTYAFPAALLEPLLPHGLVLDRYEDCGFVAIALVATNRLRPSFLPKMLGLDFFLSGYRIFTRLGSSSSALRGLYILRSDTDRQLMYRAGNIFTHYKYSLCQAVCENDGLGLRIAIKTAEGEADLSVRAQLNSRPAPLPEGSPFTDLHAARRFAGPLPYTFDYEPQTRSIIAVRGVRKRWEPEPIDVQIEKAPTFFGGSPFNQVQPVLANAFYLENVPYRWERGQRIRNR